MVRFRLQAITCLEPSSFVRVHLHDDGSMIDMDRAHIQQAEQCVRQYVTSAEEYWSGPQIIQAHKLRSSIDGASKKYSCTTAAVVDDVIGLAFARIPHRPAPVYVTGLGGSGSNWLAGILADIDGFAYAGEVYLPARLLEQFTSLTVDEQSFVVDAIHLLHTWPRTRALDRASIVNAASRLFNISLLKKWDPSCVVVYLYRDPRDQVMSVTFRKPEYRRIHAPNVSDRSYLISRCASGRDCHLKFASASVAPDIRCRYEDLKGDTLKVLKHLLERMHVDISTDALRNVIFKHDANNMRAGLVAVHGNLDQGGRSSGWRLDANVEQKQIMHSELIGVITQLGYEQCDCLGYPIVSRLPTNARVIHFPDRNPVGELFLRSSTVEQPRWHSGGSARGDVSVPQGMDVKLRVETDPTAVFGASDIRPGDIQSFCFAGNADVRLKHISAIAALLGVLELDLARTRIRDDSLAALERLSTLRGVNLYRSNVSPSAVTRLQGALPEAHIVSDNLHTT